MDGSVVVDRKLTSGARSLTFVMARLSLVSASADRSIHKSIHLCIYLSIWLSIYLSIYPSISLYISLSVYLSIYQFIFLSDCVAHLDSILPIRPAVQ